MTKFNEAFCLMQYEGDDGKQGMTIWNSRDGVTPFVITYPDTGVQMKHVRWAQDEYLPNHKPSPGDWVFVDLTEQRAKELAKANADRFWNEPHPQYDPREQFDSVQQMAEMLFESYWEGVGTSPDLRQIGSDELSEGGR